MSRPRAKPAQPEAPPDRKGVRVRLKTPHIHAGIRHEAGETIEIFSDSDLEFLKTRNIIEE